MAQKNKKDVGHQTYGKLKLVGEDGNAFAILGRARKQMKQAGASQVEIDAFIKQATAGDYQQLLGVVGEWFDVS